MPAKKNQYEPVEKFKLGPELLKVAKAYRQRDKVIKMLQGGIALKTGELTQLTDALFKVENQQEALLQMVPPEQPDVEGLPRTIDAERLQINY